MSVDSSGLHRSDQLSDDRAYLEVVGLWIEHMLVYGLSMLVIMLIGSSSILSKAVWVLRVPRARVLASNSLFSKELDEVLLVGLSVTRELGIIITAIIRLSRDLCEAIESFDRFTVDVHILNFWCLNNGTNLLFTDFPLEHLHLLLMLLNTSEDIVNQDLIVRSLV